MTKLNKHELAKPTFIRTSEHKVVFDVLKIALTTAPVLGYPDFTKAFILETNASLKGLGAVLSQQDSTGKVCVIAYMSWTLRPSKQAMHIYSSAKLELSALNWAVTKKFRTICWGQIYSLN